MKKGMENINPSHGGHGRRLFLSALQSLTMAQFNSMELGDQEAFVSGRGVLIAMRQEPEFVIRLYQLENFYVELFFHQISRQAVAVRSFSDAAGLDAYVNGLDLCFNGVM